MRQNICPSHFDCNGKTEISQTSLIIALDGLSCFSSIGAIAEVNFSQFLDERLMEVSEKAFHRLCAEAFLSEASARQEIFLHRTKHDPQNQKHQGIFRKALDQQY